MPRLIYALAGTLALVPAAACEPLAPPPAHEQQQAKAPAPAEPERATPSAPEQAPAPVAKIDPGELHEHDYRFPAPARLVAIGDVHGDLGATKRALRIAGAIDDEDHWIGGELVVVQTGDQLDRGDGEQEILELLARLQHEAHKAGGALHLLNGNHEFMNALGDFRYVTPGGFADFEDAPGVDLTEPKLARVLAQAPKPAHARAAAFLPGQPWARELAKRNTIVIVGDSVFVHGGILPAWAGKVAEVNRESRAWLEGKQPEPPKAIVDPDGPVWSRHYSDAPDASDCALLDEALATIGVARMVVGHTVHTEGITQACEGKVWMIDVGMAGHYGGPTQVLEIVGDSVKPLSG